MRVLHIINSYGGTEVYKNLITELDKLGVSQTVYVPLSVANRERVGNQLIDFRVKDSQIIYSTVLNTLDRFIYESKIAKCVKDVEKRVRIEDFDIIHAGMVLFDGAIAYKLSKKYNRPYISAIRSTDTLYYEKFFWKRSFFKKVLLNSTKLVSISPHCIQEFCGQPSLAECRENIVNETLIIPNGIDKRFLYDLYRQSRVLSNKQMRIVFVAAYQRRKGIKELIEAIIDLNKEGYKITLDAIGDGLPFRDTNADYVSELKKIATTHKEIHLLKFMDKDGIKEFLRKSDIFAMPSRKETFGLVYIEALSQGLPILYSKNDGIDGFYEDGYVGYGAIALDKEDIKRQIIKIYDDYPTLLENIRNLNFEKDFGWPSIAQKYYTIYKQVVGHE